MSAAGTAQREEVQPQTVEQVPESSADRELLQDILYDMLATGVDEEGGVTQAEIEAFLHEHARQEKPAAEFQAFFERHGLQTVALRPPAAELLELPPITTVREPPRPIGADGPIELALSDLEEIPAWAAVATKPPEPPRRRAFTRGGWFAVAALAVALLLVSWRGYIMIRELRGELTDAAERHRRDHNALQRLSDQAATLESSVAATGELIQRVDQKSDLLLDSLLPEKTQTSADQRGN